MTSDSFYYGAEFINKSSGSRWRVVRFENDVITALGMDAWATDEYHIKIGMNKFHTYYEFIGPQFSLLKCECGADSGDWLKGYHSHWCPKFTKEETE